MDQILTRLKQAMLALGMVTALVTGETFASIASGTVSPALAQDQPSGGPPASGHGNRMGKILQSLNLSDAQKTQIRAIIADARKQNRDVTDRDQKRANMRAAYAKVETVLTPAQRDALHTKMAALRQDQTQHAQ